MLRLSFKRCLADNTLGTSSPQFDSEIGPRLIAYSSRGKSWLGYGVKKRRRRRGPPREGECGVVVHEHEEWMRVGQSKPVLRELMFLVDDMGGLHRRPLYNVKSECKSLSDIACTAKCFIVMVISGYPLRCPEA